MPGAPGLQAIRHRAHYGVAKSMAVGAVQELETVQAEHHQRDWFTLGGTVELPE
jgi:hypothetical protein